MSTRVEETSQVLLELGLEDWIPLPEALEAPEVRAAAGQDDPVQIVGDALATLVLSDLVRLYHGRWEADPVPVPTAEALELLREPRWYSYHIEDPSEDRLYFVNIENIRKP